MGPIPNPQSPIPNPHSISKKLNYSKEKNIFKLNNIIIYNYKKLKKNYTNEELNELNFNESLIIDKRNFFITYFNFLKYSQIIIFTFITKSDFNLSSIKISLFLFSFIIYLTFNTLFFTDDSMSYIYKKGGSFDYIYNLPRKKYSIK